MARRRSRAGQDLGVYCEDDQDELHRRRDDIADAMECEIDNLGACLLNPSEMGIEPLKPVGEPDAANSRIRFV